MIADLVLYNGVIRTQSDAIPRASAIGIKAGKIIALGEDSKVLHSLSSDGGKKTSAIDITNASASPGNPARFRSSSAVSAHSEPS